MKINTIVRYRSAAAILFCVAAITGFAAGVHAQVKVEMGGDEILPPSKHVLQSTIQVNLTKHFVRLPLRKGTYNDGQTTRNIWFVLTDVSDQQLAIQIGLNFAPKLANAPRGCPGCVQILDFPANITTAANVAFKGVPDFSPPTRSGPRAYGISVFDGPGRIARRIFLYSLLAAHRNEYRL